ncbi:hypothetical protein [Asticcacaulis sp. 201]|uniref:hypothetical protein n=1 Tax=Asticcacaulis sp. 201 TaxID=3028787 RepID=UPI0029163BFB|nr:hypothetical protein [Asticcacaulis sp. 201]MDV6330110.1 hypothetical protein [Asticcacaulis sp. 201]
MKLSNLIQEALSEIAIGVREAKEKSRSIIAIAPGTLNDEPVSEITYIEFDVSIVVSEANEESNEKEKSAGGELKVLSVGVNGEAKGKTNSVASQSSQLTHRISFKVPVCMAADFSHKERVKYGQL